MLFQVLILTRNVPSLVLFRSGAVFWLELATVLRWWGPSLFDGITCILWRSTKGLYGFLFLFLYLRIVVFWLTSFLPFNCLVQVWEEALQHPRPHLTVLPCEGRRSRDHWPVQVFVYTKTFPSNGYLCQIQFCTYACPFLESLMFVLVFVLFVNFQAVVKDSAVQRSKGDSCWFFYWWEEGFYRNVKLI